MSEDDTLSIKTQTITIKEDKIGRKSEGFSSGSTTFNSGSSNAERIIKHINALLVDVPAVAHLLPLSLDGPNSFFEVSRDGILLAELINVLLPGYIRIDKIHRDLSNPLKCHFLKLENQTMVLRACQKFGCHVVNLGPCDLTSGKSYLILGIVWQIIKRGLVERIKMNFDVSSADDRQAEGKTERVDNDEETEELIIKMVNDQVEREDIEKVQNLSEDLVDGKVIGQLLLNAGCKNEYYKEIVSAETLVKRADAIVKAGQEILGPLCILENRDFVQGNHQMIILFLAALLKKAAETKVEERVIELDTSDFEARIKMLESEIVDLRKENESLSDQLVTMHAELEASRNPHVVEEPLLTDPMDAFIENHDELDGKIFRDNTGKLAGFYIPTDENAFRLRQIYQNTANVTQLASFIYGPLTVSNLQVEKSPSSTRTPIISGHLRKKDWNAHKWRRRFFILRDNFLFCFAEEAGPKDVALDVLRVDDALVRVMFEVRHMEDPVISVEIASKANPFYLYLSADAMALYKWKEAVTRASAYWLLTR